MGRSPYEFDDVRTDPGVPPRGGVVNPHTLHLGFPYLDLRVGGVCGVWEAFVLMFWWFAYTAGHFSIWCQRELARIRLHHDAINVTREKQAVVC